MLLALMDKQTPVLAAKLVLLFSLPLHIYVHLSELVDLHFLHLVGLFTLVNCVIMLVPTLAGVGARARPLARIEHERQQGAWQYAVPASVVVVACVAGFYLYFGNFIT